MNHPNISVIISTYRCAENLPQLIDCLKKQTIGFGQLEILFADDHSQDGTGAAIDALAAEYENIRALHLPENSGFAGAPRNAALRAATAPYVMFLDADDILPPNACALLHEELLRTDADLATGYCRRVLPDGTLVQEISPPYAAIPAHISELPRDLAHELVMRDSFFCRIYRRRIIAEHNLFFPERTPGEDIFFLYSYLLHCRKTVYLAKPVYDYTLSNTSVTHNQTAEYYQKLGACYHEMRQLFESAGQSALFPMITERILEQHLRGMAMLKSCSEKALADALSAWEWLFLLESEADPLGNEAGRMKEESGRPGNDAGRPAEEAVRAMQKTGRLADQPLAASILPFVRRGAWEDAARFLQASLPLCAALDKSQAQAEEWKGHALALQQSVRDIRNSRSWRLTHPFSKRDL